MAFSFISCDELESVFAYGLTGSSVDLDIQNNRISATGDTYIFETTETPDIILSKVKEKYLIFSAEDNNVQFVNNNEVFSLILTSSVKNKYVYCLSNECIAYNRSDESKDTKFLPFPCSKVYLQQQLSDVYDIDVYFDKQYLLDFYSFYKDAKIKDNVITYNDFTVYYNDYHIKITQK